MLPRRQAEVAKLLVEGKSAKEIAYLLKIGVPTVVEYIGVIYRKLGVSSRGECVAKLMAQQQDLLVAHESIPSNPSGH